MAQTLLSVLSGAAARIQRKRNEGAQRSAGGSPAGPPPARRRVDTGPASEPLAVQPAGRRRYYLRDCAMIVATTIEEVRSATGIARTHGARLGFIPTMGLLHDGHLSLIHVARENGADFIVVSIFVNPKQFGPNEDFSRYPRDEARDTALLESKDVDLLFLPPVDVMYPPGAQTTVSIAGVAAPLEGERRPGHFDGVATVVLKLFNIVQPDLAVFGRKDAQQCAVIDGMVRDLDVPVQLVFAGTAREQDGLARSSRNSYLSAEERKLAPSLHRALRAGEEAITHGIHDVDAVETLMRRMIEETPGVEVDYLAVVDPKTFLPPIDFRRDVLLAGAVRIGRTRLIDNIQIDNAR